MDQWEGTMRILQSLIEGSGKFYRDTQQKFSEPPPVHHSSIKSFFHRNIENVKICLINIERLLSYVIQAKIDHKYYSDKYNNQSSLQLNGTKYFLL